MTSLNRMDFEIPKLRQGRSFGVSWRYHWLLTSLFLRMAMMPFHGAGMSGKSNRLNSPGRFCMAKIIECSFHCNLSVCSRMVKLIDTGNLNFLTQSIRHPFLSIRFLPFCDVELLKHVLDIGVGSEKDVQACLVPIPILILPCCNLCKQSGD